LNDRIYTLRFFLNAPENCGTATVKRAYALWVGQILDLESDVALTPATVLDMCDKKSFTQSYYFLYQNATCKIHIGTMSFHVQYLCEK
jgi:hypothetical protein